MEVEEQEGPSKGWTWADPPKSEDAPTGGTVVPRPGNTGGRGTAFDPEKAQRGVDLATTPLARPTGIDMIDGFTSPIGIASLAAGGAGIARAGVAGGVAAGAKEALATATPVLKYEATKTILEKMGVPSSMATIAAMAVSGYKKGAKAAPPAAEVAPAVASPPSVPANATGTSFQPAPLPIGRAAAEADALLARASGGAPMPTPVASAAPPAGVPPVEPVASAPVAPAPPAAAVASTAAPPPTAGSPPSALSPQAAANAEALAARRAAYQAKLAQQAPEAPTATGKPSLLAAESKELERLLRSGKTLKEALESIQMQRALNAQLGLTVPTAADTRFPKGMRGGAPE